MNQLQLRWINAFIPVDTAWRPFFLSEVLPFLTTIQNNGVINRWHFRLNYRRGLYIILELEANANLVYDYLLPSLKDKFGHISSSRSLEDDNLNGFDQSFSVQPAERSCTYAEEFDQFNWIGSELFSSHQERRLNLKQHCLSEIFAAIQAADWTESELLEFTTNNFGQWLDRYLCNRYSFQQLDERYEQERELTKFLQQQTNTPILPIALENKNNWDEAAAELFKVSAANPMVFKAAIDRHVMRYGLSPFETGSLWLQLTKSQTPKSETQFDFNFSYGANLS